MINRLDLEYLMNKPVYFFSLNLLFSAIIYGACALGQIMGIEGQLLPISILWPATGISLAVLLLYGVKAWPSIFVGNFIYNFAQVSPDFLIAFLVSFGSLLQALLGAWILREFSTKSLLSTTYDMLRFLLFGGLVTCFIASTLGVLTLYYLGVPLQQSLLYTWLTFWLGDTMGIYIFTPLIVVWLILPPPISLKQNLLEALLMCFTFLILTYYIFILSYPLPQLYIPLAMWTSYRFRLHGATVAILIIALTSLAFTAAGRGVFLHIDYPPLLVLASYLQTVVILSLIVAAIVNERDLAWSLLKNQNLDLQHKVEKDLEEKEEFQKELIIKDKLASLSNLYLEMANRIQAPISELKNQIIECNDLESLKKTLNDFSFKADHILNLINQKTELAKGIHMSVDLINIHILLSECLEILNKVDFPIIIFKEFDGAVPLLSASVIDLRDSFILIIQNALSSMEKKKELLGFSYDPRFLVKTEKEDNQINIIFYDNGYGIPEDQVSTLFQQEDSLTLAHDIIVHIHHGSVAIESIEGEYQKITLTLPFIFLSSQRFHSSL